MRRQVSLLILITAAMRLAFGASTGLGVDESYMISAGRVLSLGYFDHPPLAWWLSWAATHLAGSETPVVARMPFITLFALTTWLVARLGEAVGGPRAGFWAAVTLNLSPVFGITTATWVLPDGPLDCALAGAALCLFRALDRRSMWRDWCGAGACAGLAMASKYSAVLTIAGALVFLTLNREHRVWLRQWQPYCAAAIALLVFSPVIVWNVSHDWASFAFQGARAGGLRFRPFAPLATLGGEALFVLPWFWLPMAVLGWRALFGWRPKPGARTEMGGRTVMGGRATMHEQPFRAGWPEQMLACLAAPPIVVFALISAWSSQRVLYHWAAPGYLMLFPLLGRFVAGHWDRKDVRATVFGTAALCLASVTAVATQLQFDWLRGLPLVKKDPTAEGLDWTSLRDDLIARDLLRPGTVVGVPNWRDAGKIAHALGPATTVICLCRDSRQFGFGFPVPAWAGADVLLLVADRPDTVMPALRDLFSRIDTLPPSAVSLRGRTLKTVTVAVGHGLSPTARLP